MRVYNEYRKELLEKAKYIQFPKQGRYVNYKEHTYVRLPIIDNSMYGNYQLNEHHFKPHYHWEYVLPTIFKELGIDFNLSDFDIIEANDNGHDISKLVPKKEYRFEVFGYTTPEHIEDCGFDIITSCNKTEYAITQYHKMYRYPHECSCVINKTINNDRILFISGDSQMIPNVSVLCCYFKKVYFFDNRDCRQYFEKIGDDNITDVLIMSGYDDNERKYYSTNLL